MKRRRFFQTIGAASATPALMAQQPAAAPARQAPVGGEPAKLEVATADDAGDTVARFFTPLQLATLRKLGEIIMPSIGGAPGATEAKAAEFLDFLVGQSPAEKQNLYRVGLDQLNAQARKRYRKVYSELDPAQAGELLAPLREAWTYDPPADPLAAFLRAAKADIRTATINSREYNAASSTSGGRRPGGVGAFFLPLD